ncbi:hypothetical protein [Nocardia sp. alder85J]|uniref:hypothetical protein n=1 Tax=Nocardia sp. alder85J TaxID=2862949 RepID=UPI002B1CE1BE|nr:hypothetical protein [Nocardia sp. alder85J]
MLSRMREEWSRSGRTAADNRHAVAMGLARWHARRGFTELDDEAVAPDRPAVRTGVPV